MTKLEMAHDCALTYIKYGDGKTHYKDVVEFAWLYADAMQAEADKRVDMERPAVLQDEWQPDWSVAPKLADIWQKSSADNYYWYCGDTCLGAAPSFNYQGDWKNSLRKRP